SYCLPDDGRVGQVQPLRHVSNDVGFFGREVDRDGGLKRATLVARGDFVRLFPLLRVIDDVVGVVHASLLRYLSYRVRSPLVKSWPVMARILFFSGSVRM